MDEALLAFIILLLLGAVLLGPFLLARRRGPIEQGRTPQYETVCTGFVSRFAGTNIPSIRLAIYDSFMVITWLFVKTIPFTAIEDARVSHNLLGPCVLIKLKSGLTLRLNAKDPERVAKLLNHAQKGSPDDVSPAKSDMRDEP